MDLHGKIMNLNCVQANMDAEPNQRLAYKAGHRDARHGAAELALQADACVAALRRIIESAERHQAAINTFLLLDAREALAALDGDVLVSG
jgi:hypothetical protein